MNQRQQFAETVTRLMREDEKIVLLLADVGTYGFRDAFIDYPKRCFNTGPAEQAAIGVAAGFAKEGFYPIVHSFSSFLCRRAYEQIYLDFGEQRLSGMFVGIHGYEKFGPSHCCPEDFNLMGNVRAMWLVERDPIDEIGSALAYYISQRQLAYVRLT